MIKKYSKVAKCKLNSIDVLISNVFNRFSKYLVNI